VLVLALVFLVVIAMMVGGLASWTANNLSNTLTFQQERTAEYSLTSGTQVAIQSIRYTPLIGTNQTLNASPPTYCWGSGADSYGGTAYPPSPESNTVNVEVFCSTVWNPTSAATRVVTISACLQSVLTGPTPAATCALNPGLQTVVTFDDYSPSNPNVNQGICVTTCGYGMTINSSTSKTAAPVVSGLSTPSTGPVYPAAPNTSLTITGSGFVSGSLPCANVNPVPACGENTVAFVSTNTGAVLNISLPATVTAATATSLTVTIPASTVVTSYYVVVTTPSGSSATGSQAVYTYTSMTPTVSSIATASADSALGQQVTGSAAGGTALTITGTGFLSNVAQDSTSVWFIDTATGNSVPVTTLTVNSSTSITVTAPSVSSANLTYDVVVSTSPSTGQSSPTVPADVFTYQVLTPVIGGVSPASGTGGSQTVTITGVGFVSGATTITLVPPSGNTLTATNVSVSTSTSLTATIPSGGKKGTVYAVEATTSGGNSGTGGPANQYTY
jgi:hypothetical protein